MIMVLGGERRREVIRHEIRAHKERVHTGDVAAYERIPLLSSNPLQQRE